MTSTVTKWIGMYGEFYTDSRTAVINGDQVVVPVDVVSRGARLAYKYKLYESAYEYALKWAARKLGLI